MSNLQASLAFRHRVLLYLHAQGFSGATDAAARMPTTTLSELIGSGGPEIQGDILGLPWTLAVRNQRGLNLSGAMSEVEIEAEAEGKPFYASVQARAGHAISESYVTMPLSVFVEVLRRLHPEQLSDGYAPRSAS